MLTTTTSVSGTNTTGTTPNNKDNINNSYMNASMSDKTVILYDWWLIKSEKDYNGRRLAVGGSTSEGIKAGKIFSSAPIVKRYDFVTLETADGLTVSIKGIINRTLTQENGFSSKVCQCFLIGFPCIWEEFSYHCEEDSISSNTSRGLSDCGSLKDGESNWKSSEEKIKDAVVDSASEMTAEVMAPIDIEQRKRDSSLDEYNVRSEVVLTTLENHHRDCSSKLSKSNITLEDHRVPTGSDDKNSSTLFKLDKDNKEESRRIFSLEWMKDLSDRIKALCSPKIATTNLSDSVRDDDVNDMEIPVKESITAKSLNLTNADLLDVTRKTVITFPKDSPKVLVNNSNGNNCDTELDRSEHLLMESGSNVICCTSSEVNMLPPGKNPKDFIRKNSSNAFGTSCGNTKSKKCTRGSSAARRSGRLINMRKGTDNSQEVITNNLTSNKETTRHDASRDILKELGSGVSVCNPDEENLVSSLEVPRMSLKSFSGKGTFEKSSGDNLARHNSHKEPLKAKSSSKLMTMKEDNNQQRTTRNTNKARRSTRLTNRPKGSDNRQETVGKKSFAEHPDNGPQSKTRKRLQNSTNTKATPIAKIENNESSVLSPEKSNYKRTKSGRLRVPPLPFWQNQRIIYDKDLEIAGILNGVPAVESPTVTAGSDSNPVRKKLKFI